VISLVSYLSPGLPTAIFEGIGERLAGLLGIEVDVSFVTGASGPDPVVGLDGADLAFVCAPSYAELRARLPVALVPMAPVFDDPRAAGLPVYFSDVVVGPDSDAANLDDLVSARWAVNDERSLSGYGCVVKALGLDVVSVFSGGHRKSMDPVLRGEVDAAAIDANVLKRSETSGLRIVHTFGPHPIQPLIAAPGFARIDDVAQALQVISIPSLGLSGFARVREDDYGDF